MWPHNTSLISKRCSANPTSLSNKKTPADAGVFLFVCSTLSERVAYPNLPALGEFRMYALGVVKAMSTPVYLHTHSMGSLLCYAYQQEVNRSQSQRRTRMKQMIGTHHMMRFRSNMHKLLGSRCNDVAYPDAPRSAVGRM